MAIRFRDTYIFGFAYFGFPILIPVAIRFKKSLSHASLGNGISPSVNISQMVTPALDIIKLVKHLLQNSRT